MDLAGQGSPDTRPKFRKIAKAFADQEVDLALSKRNIDALDTEFKVLRPKRPKKVPNPK